MYCKHCGKQITDDSLFCQFCGGKQDAPSAIEDRHVVKNTSNNNADSSSTLLNKEKKKYVVLYAIWTILHCVCWMFGRPFKSGVFGFSPQSKFYPFTQDSYNTNFFDVDYYDSTEFLVYVLLIPLAMYFYFQYCHKPLIRKIKGNKK